MATVTAATLTATEPAREASAAGRRRRRATGWGRALVLTVAAVYFVGPLAAAAWFTVTTPTGVSWRAYQAIPGAAGFAPAVVLSLQIAVITVALSLVTVVPALLAAHLRHPGVRPLLDVLSLLPLVVPPIVLVVGVGKLIAWGNTTDTSTPQFAVTNQLLNSHPPMILPLLYTVLALPFTYRSIDAGMRAVPMTVLAEAARGLGAGWPTIVVRVLLPTLRSAVTTAALLTFALAFGEFTVASILQYQPFTVWLLQFTNSDGQLTVALSLLSLALTWVLLLVITLATSGRPGRRVGRVTAHTPTAPDPSVTTQSGASA